MSIKINCIVVEDQPLAQEKMVDYISKVDYLNLQKVFDNCFEALNFIKSTKTDLIFLDIQMDDFNGIQFLESISRKPKIILTTAYDTYALKSYELDVNDYLLKPISFNRFLKAVEKIYALIEQHEHKPMIPQPEIAENLTHTDDKEFIFVRSDYKMKKILLSEILFVEGMKDYLAIYTLTQRVLTLMSFKQIENILPSNKFVRIHKSYIISIEHIDSFDKSNVYIANKSIPIGETYKQFFINFLETHRLL